MTFCRILVRGKLISVPWYSFKDHWTCWQFVGPHPLLPLRDTPASPAPRSVDAAFLACLLPRFPCLLPDWPWKPTNRWEVGLTILKNVFVMFEPLTPNHIQSGFCISAGKIQSQALELPLWQWHCCSSPWPDTCWPPFISKSAQRPRPPPSFGQRCWITA